MDASEHHAMKKCLPSLCKKLNLTEVIVHLESCEVLTDIMVQEIMETKTDYARNYKTLSYLRNASLAHGIDIFGIFIKILQDTNQDNLAEELMTSKNHARGGSVVDVYQTPVSERNESLLQEIKLSLQNYYIANFKMFAPVSFCNFYDIETTFVDLSFSRGDQNLGQDHHKILQNCFPAKKIVVVEGSAGSGKSTLARRICHDWACGNFGKFDLVIFAQFRSHNGRIFSTIKELVQASMQKYLNAEQYKIICALQENEALHNFLYVLDGYDEVEEPGQCQQLYQILIDKTSPSPDVSCSVLIFSRPDATYAFSEDDPCFFKLILKGFGESTQKYRFIKKHFANSPEKIVKVNGTLRRFPNLDHLAKTPLYLFLICLVHEKLKRGTLRELFEAFVWWLIDRYQTKNPSLNVPSLFGFENNVKNLPELSSCIEDNWQTFPHLQKLGHFALHMQTFVRSGVQVQKLTFSKKDVDDFHLEDVIFQSGFLICDKEDTDDKLTPRQSFCFPHRQLQEFFSIFFCIYWHREKNCSHCNEIEEIPPINCSLIPDSFNEMLKVFQELGKFTKIKKLELAFMWYGHENKTFDESHDISLVLPETLKHIQFVDSQIEFENLNELASMFASLHSSSKISLLSFQQCHISFIAMASLLNDTFDYDCDLSDYQLQIPIIAFAESYGALIRRENLTSIRWRDCIISSSSAIIVNRTVEEWATAASSNEFFNCSSSDFLASLKCIEMLKGKQSSRALFEIRWCSAGQSLLEQVTSIANRFSAGIRALVPSLRIEQMLNRSQIYFRDLNGMKVTDLKVTDLNTHSYEKRGCSVIFLCSPGGAFISVMSEDEASELRMAEFEMINIKVESAINFSLITNMTEIFFHFMDFQTSVPFQLSRELTPLLKKMEFHECSFSLSSFLSVAQFISQQKNLQQIWIKEPFFPDDTKEFITCLEALCQWCNIRSLRLDFEEKENVDFVSIISLLIRTMTHLEKLEIDGDFLESISLENRVNMVIEGVSRKPACEIFFLCPIKNITPDASGSSTPSSWVTVSSDDDVNVVE